MWPAGTGCSRSFVVVLCVAFPSTTGYLNDFETLALETSVFIDYQRHPSAPGGVECAGATWCDPYDVLPSRTNGAGAANGATCGGNSACLSDYCDRTTGKCAPSGTEDLCRIRGGSSPTADGPS